MHRLPRFCAITPCYLRLQEPLDRLQTLSQGYLEPQASLCNELEALSQHRPRLSGLKLQRLLRASLCEDAVPAVVTADYGLVSDVHRLIAVHALVLNLILCLALLHRGQDVYPVQIGQQRCMPRTAPFSPFSGAHGFETPSAEWPSRRSQ